MRAFVFMNRLFEYECSEAGLSLVQYRMLLYLRHGPKRAGELANQASITRPSLSGIVSTLEKQKLLHRTTVHADRRGVRLELTRAGTEAIERIESRCGEVLDSVAADCDTDALMSSLDELATAMSDQIEARVRADVPPRPE